MSKGFVLSRMPCIFFGPRSGLHLTGLKQVLHKESIGSCYSCDLRYSMVQTIPASFGKVVPEPTHTPDICSPESTKSLGCDRPMGPCGPVHDPMINRMLLRSFLREYGFKEGDLYSARPGGCFFKRESLCPIHVAAMTGERGRSRSRERDLQGSNGYRLCTGRRFMWLQ